MYLGTVIYIGYYNFLIQVVITAKTLHKFYDKLHELMSQNSTISPIILGSPYSFFNEYAAGILGSKHNFAQVNECMDRSSCMYMTFAHT